MVLHGHVKQCKNVNLTWGGWGFYDVFGDRPTKLPIEKTKSKHAPRQLINKDLQ
jgi:hypothetical protein